MKPLRRSYLLSIPVFILSTGIFFSCQNTIEEINRAELEENLPMRTISNGTFVYSEKGRIINKLKAVKFLQYKNQDIHISEGMWMEIYNKQETPEATLSSISGVFQHEQNILTARDSVVLANNTGDTLFTEEIILYQDSDLIISNYPIKIKQKNNVIFGTGLRANTSFTSYEIKNPARSRIMIPEDSIKYNQTRP